MKLLKIFSFALFFIAIFLGGCSSEKFISKRANSKIQIDGKDNDWQNKTKYFKDQNVLIGVQNNNKNLYLLMETNDRQRIRQIMGRGFIIWFDNSGGSSKKFGVKFPIGRRESRNMGMRELEIYNPHTESWDLVSFNEAKGIKIALNRNRDKLIYEMKISLDKKNSSYFLQPENGKIGIGFTTPEFSRNMKMRSGRDENGVKIGMGGREGREAGEGGMGEGREFGEGRRGGQRPNLPEQFKLWLTVNLASK